MHKTTFHSVKQPLAEQSRFKDDYNAEEMIEEEPDAENDEDMENTVEKQNEKEVDSEDDGGDEDGDDGENIDEDVDEDPDEDEELDSESDVDLHEDLDLGKRIAKEDRRIRGEPTPDKSSQLSSSAKQASLIKSNEVKDVSQTVV